MRRPKDGPRAGASRATDSRVTDSRVTGPPTTAVPELDTLYGAGHLADVDLHFGRLIAELDGGGGRELPLAAALASAWTRDGHACLALSEVAGRDWPRTGAGAVRLPALEPWIEALNASPMAARPEDGERRPLVLDRHGRLYLERLRTAEQAVADGLLRLAEDDAGGDPKGPDAASGARIPESGPNVASGRNTTSVGRIAESGPNTASGDRIPEGGRNAASGPNTASVGRTPKNGPRPEPDGLDAALDRLFPGATPDDRSRAAARTAVLRRLCVVSGGPGTGKTTTAAAIVALLVELGLAAPDRIALAAPTGKAAARLQEAVRGQRQALLSRAPALEGFDPRATTVHRWLLHHARKGGAADALILDEGSMVDLTLMAQVLRALPDGARLVLLGDASQLASVQPGSVFADLCRAGEGRAEDGTRPPQRSPEADRETAPSSRQPTVLDGAPAIPHRGIAKRPPQRSPLTWNKSAPRLPAVLDEASAIPHRGIAKRPPQRSPLASCVVELVRNWRFDERGGLGRLAAAVVRGDAPAAVAALQDPSDRAAELRPLPDAAAFERLAVRFADERFAPALREARKLRGPPAEGAGPLPSFRVLCAHRVGPFGAERFNRSVERRLRALGLVGTHDPFYPGRPILVTRNDPRTRLSNGDTGVVLRDAAGRAQVWFPELEDADGGPRLVPPARLPPHESFFALTVHRAQGSEYDEVAVAPGPADSRVVTRELLYTAVTRARRRVVVYGSGESVAAAAERSTKRSSGLRDALARPRGR